jgi:thiol-disulfide isomerase/thioredoxin
MPLPLICLMTALPAAQAPAPASEAQGVLDAARAKAKAVGAARSAFVTAGGNTKDFKGDCTKELATLEARLAAAQDPALRQALLVSTLYHLQLAKTQPSATLLAQVRKEVPPTAAAWSLEPGLLSARATADPAGWGPYVAEARAKHADPALRRALLFDAFLEGLDTGDEPAWKAALQDIRTQFPGPLADRAQSFLDAEAKTAPGLPAPAFSLKALGNPATAHTLESFKGRYLLIDFWATWCPDCRAELPAVQAAWARFQGKSLDLLSLSFDRRVEHLTAFLQPPATPMPWKHAFVEGGFQSPVAEAYGVKSIPRMVLVGPDGTIVASGASLRGARLAQTLEKVLGK